jgi:hypothetical protein
VEELALFRGEFHSSVVSPLLTCLPCALEVLASLQRIFAEGKEVEVICESDSNQSMVLLELCVEAGCIEEKENRGERRALWYSSGYLARRRRLAIEVETGLAVREEAVYPPNSPGRESLVL